MGVSKKIGVPQNGWFIIEKKPIKMDDLGIPLFSETSISTKVNHTVGLRQSNVEAGFSVGKKPPSSG